MKHVSNLALPAQSALTIKQWQSWYLSLGLATFPLIPNGKKPPFGCTYSDLNAAEQWQVSPGQNIAIATGARSGIFVIDLDMKDGKDGVAAFKALGDCPNTLRATTPSGGYHLVFRLPHGAVVPNSAGKLGKGIDVRGKGGYIVAAPSVIDGLAYEWIDPNVPIADAPQWLLDLVVKQPSAPTLEWQPYTGNVPLAKRIELATEWLATMKLAIIKKGGDPAIFAAMCTLVRGYALPADTARELFVRDYNPRCQPPWSDREIDHNLKGAIERGTDTEVGSALNDHAIVVAIEKHASAAKPDHNIQIGADGHRVVQEAINALACDESIYQRDGKLARVVHVVESDADNHCLAVGTPIISHVHEATLWKTLCAVAKWWRFDGRSKKLVATDPSKKIVSAVAHEKQYPASIRPIAGIVTTPSMRPDGSIIDAPGYDDATGYLYAPDGTFPAVPLHPTRDDAWRARETLADVFVDFPFLDAAHRHVVIAAVMTLVCRPAIAGNVPMFASDATLKGAGKSLVNDVVSIIATGSESYKLDFPASDEELEKRLSAYARVGARLVNFDDVAIPVQGQALNRVLTARGRVALRVLGTSDREEHVWRAVVLVSGNQLKISGDTTRRTIVSRMVPKQRRPYERDAATFKHPERKGVLPAWCREHRGELVAACLTLLRAYILAGRPEQGLTSKAFDEWQVIPDAIKWSGGPDIMSCWADDADDDESEDVLDQLLAWWVATYPKGATASVAATLLLANFDLRESLTNVCGGELTPRSLARYLRSVRDVYAGGLCMQRGEKTNAGILWKVVRVA